MKRIRKFILGSAFAVLAAGALVTARSRRDRKQLSLLKSPLLAVTACLDRLAERR